MCNTFRVQFRFYLSIGSSNCKCTFRIFYYRPCHVEVVSLERIAVVISPSRHQQLGNALLMGIPCRTFPAMCTQPAMRRRLITALAELPGGGETIFGPSC
jgi:hypothetical protein